MPPADNHPQRCDGARFSKLAIAALLLAPLPAVATIVVGIAVFRVLSVRRQGWDGLGDVLFTGMAAQVLLIGGTICAGLTVALGAGALWRIRRRRNALRGRWAAGTAIFIGIAWLALAWGSAVTLVVLVKHYFE